MDGRNPFRTTLKVLETITFVGILQGNHPSRVSDVVQDFVHPQYGHSNHPALSTSGASGSMPSRTAAMASRAAKPSTSASHHRGLRNAAVGPLPKAKTWHDAIMILFLRSAIKHLTLFYSVHNVAVCTHCSVADLAKAPNMSVCLCEMQACW